jgi:uncharacterized membrane protein
MSFRHDVEQVGKGLDIAGVAVIVAGVVSATAGFAARFGRAGDFEDRYRTYRQNIGRAILLGLEFLVAADIIRTVAVSPTFRSAGVLAIIVVIRTFLSMALQLELEGRWPWQRPRVGMPSQPS